MYRQKIFLAEPGSQKYSNLFLNVNIQLPDQVQFQWSCGGAHASGRDCQEPAGNRLGRIIQITGSDAGRNSVKFQ